MPKSSKKQGKFAELMEKYSSAALITLLAIFAIEMVVFVALLQRGVDLQPMMSWFQDTLGVDVSWIQGKTGTIAVAYALTRLTKPITLPLVAVLTPFVARVMGKNPPTPAEEAEEAQTQAAADS